MNRPVSLIAVAVLIRAIWPAFAEEEASPAAADRTYVVTASRVAEEALAAPALVTVVTAEDIAESGARSVVEALENVVGVSFRSQSNAAQAQPTMRGFGENSFGRVLVLVDGRELNNPDMQTMDWLSVNLADVERIEVLQGSAAVRYGDKAVGGVINIITKRPEGRRIEAGLGVGSFGANRESFSASMGDEGSGVSVAAEHYGAEGYRERSGYRSANASVRGVKDLSESLTLAAGASLADIFFEMPGALSKEQFEDDPQQATNWADESREHSYAFDASADWKAGSALSVKVPVSYAIKDLAVDMASWYTPSYTDRLVNSFEFRPLAAFDTSVADLPLRLVAGTDVKAAFLDVTSYAEVQRDTKTDTFNMTQIAVGPYVTARLSLTDTVSIESGVRYDREMIAAENRDGSVDGSAVHQALVYDAGISYRPVEAAKIYLRYATLFRYPFADEQAMLYFPKVFLDDLEAERGWNVEIGTSAALSRILTVDATAYYLAMRDEIAYDAIDGLNKNIDETRRIGGDLGFTVVPAPFVEFRGTYGYVDAVFGDGDNEGDRVPLVSAHRLDAEVVLKAPIGLSAAPRVSFRSDAAQGGDFSNDLDPIEAYAVYGLTLRFAPTKAKGAVDVTAKVDNIFDLAYAPYVYYDSYYPAEGRSFSLNATFRY